MRFPVLAFFTTKNIKAGDELTWCYAESYQMEGEDLVECVCGAANCSKEIKFKRTLFVSNMNDRLLGK